MADETIEPQQAGRSTLVVGAGLVLLGVSASVFLVLAARAVGPEAFAGVAVLWTLIYTVGIGLFLPFEQEVARAVAHRGAHGHGGAPVVRRATQLAAGLLAFAVLVGIVGFPALVGWMGDSVTNAIVLLVACGALGAQYLARGVFSGSGRFTPYAVQIGVEGTVRLVACAVLILVGVTDPIPYAVLLAAAPLVSLVMTAVPLRRLASVPGPAARLSEVSVNLGWLIGASLSAQGLANLGTVAVTVLATASEQAAAGQFLAGFTIARSPLFVFAAVQAVLLPGLTRHLAHGRHANFRRQLRLVLTITLGIGVAGVAGAFLIGPWVLKLLFGAGFAMTRGDMTLLALSSAVYMVALVLQPAVIALAEHRGNAVAWMSGVFAFVLVLLVPVDTFLRVELALIAGAACVTVILALLLVRNRPSFRGLTDPPEPASYRLGLE